MLPLRSNSSFTQAVEVRGLKCLLEQDVGFRGKCGTLKPVPTSVEGMIFLIQKLLATLKKKKGDPEEEKHLSD